MEVRGRGIDGEKWGKKEEEEEEGKGKNGKWLTGEEDSQDCFLISLPLPRHSLGKQHFDSAVHCLGVAFGRLGQWLLSQKFSQFVIQL